MQEKRKEMGGSGNGIGIGNQQKNEVVVVMVPFPAQGHLNQLLHLSRLISSYNLPVHYVASPAHSHQARLRLHGGWDPLLHPNIHFHHFPNPNSSPSPSPSLHFHSHLRYPFTALLRQLSLTATRVVVIHDSLMGSVIQDLPSIPNAESYTFHSVSAFSIFLFLWEASGKPKHHHLLLNNNILEHNNIPSLDSCFTLEFLNFIAAQHQFKKLNSGNIYNTSKSIEGRYVDLLDSLDIYGGKKKHWALGPFNPLPPLLPLSLSQSSPNNKNNKRHRCLEWLDKQSPMSVLLVSFGTSTSLTDEQIRELAIGLESSKQKFIWVLREADKGDVFVGEKEKGGRRSAQLLPQGYEERVGVGGLVVRDWAPQLEILGHTSTGGFMSHCGWNSCLESISMGVPMAAWPMHSDQPRNTVLVCQVLKVGLVLRDWAQREQLVPASTIQKVVTRLMASKEGDDMRKRAADLGYTIRKSMDEGGVTRQELDSFIDHITR